MMWDLREEESALSLSYAGGVPAPMAPSFPMPYHIPQQPVSVHGSSSYPAVTYIDPAADDVSRSANIIISLPPKHKHKHSHSHSHSHSRKQPRARSDSHSHSHSHHTAPEHRPVSPTTHGHYLPLNSQFQYSKCTGRKKALCIGINYIGQPHELRGCINDARHVRDFLIKDHGYRAGDIVLLTDDSRNPRAIPTRKNILDAMRWLVRSAKTHDSLFFHYSGHGGQTKDIDGDEIDGWDETIYPVDFKKTSHIVDDEMHDIMVKPIPQGCRLTALFDSCHSGTVLDLPYIYSSHGRLKGSQIKGPSRRQRATPADVISWSGCEDHQTSADTFAGGKAVGAMSYAFITSLTRTPNQTYRELLKSVRLILYPKYSQKPQLGSSHPIDTSLQFII